MKARAGKALIKSDALFALIVAFVFSVVALLTNSTWLFNPYEWVDHWGYLGHSPNLVELRNAFPNDPSGDLLPVIWPAAFLQFLFPDTLVAYIHGGINFF